MPPEKILFVDDEAFILDTFRRNLRRHFTVDTAQGPERGLAALTATGPYAVVVSDLRMPGMDGVRFLAKVKELSPDTVRIMLTAFADLESAVAAVNEGHVFRFLTKPCDTDILVRSLAAALDQYRLVTAERELLRGTLRGSVKVLVDILSLADPVAFGRSERIKRLAVDTARELKLPDVWKIELAAMFSELGCVSVPEEILAKRNAGTRLAPEEARVYARRIGVAVRLLKNIPRLEEVAAIIARQGESLAPDPAAPVGSKLLRLAEDFDDMLGQGLSREEAAGKLHQAAAGYGPELVAAFDRAVFRDKGYAPRRLALRELRPGMILAADVIAGSGMLLLAKGQELTELILERLTRQALARGVVEPVDVDVPLPLCDALHPGSEALASTAVVDYAI